MLVEITYACKIPWKILEASNPAAYNILNN